MSRVGAGLGQGWTWVGLGLDLGWTIKLINVLNVSVISPIGLDYGKNTRIFSEKIVQANQSREQNLFLSVHILFLFYFLIIHVAPS